MPNRDVVTPSILTLMPTKSKGYEDCNNKKLIPNTDFLKSKYNTMITIM